MQTFSLRMSLNNRGIKSISVAILKVHIFDKNDLNTVTEDTLSDPFHELSMSHSGFCLQLLRENGIDKLRWFMEQAIQFQVSSPKISRHWLDR